MSALARWWFAPAPAERLATLRILIGAFAWVYTVARLPHFADFASFEASAFRPVGPVSVLDAPLPTAATWTLAVVTAVVGLAFLLGAAFRITGPLFAALLLWVTSYASSFGMIFHTENLLVLHVIALGLSPAAAAYSLDARRRPAHAEGAAIAGVADDRAEPPGEHGGDDGDEPRSAEDDADEAYGWPIRLMATVTVITYVIAGVAKLENEGITWVTTDFLRDYVAYDALRKIELGSWHSPVGAWLAERSWPWRPLAAFSLATELGAPLALIGRRAAAVWTVCAVAFHLGVLALMAVLFAYPLLGFAFAPFFRVERLAAWARERGQSRRCV